MQRGGAEVHFLLGRFYESVRREGLKIKSCNGDFHLQQVHAYNNVRQIPAVDLVFIGLKTTANDQYEPLIGPLAEKNPRAAILTAQNGLGNEERLAELFGAERIYGGLGFLCSNRLPDGTIHHLDYGHLHVGKYQGEPAPAEPSGEAGPVFAKRKGGQCPPYPREFRPDKPDAVLREFAALLEAGGMTCKVVDDLALARWKKLEWNVPFNGLSAELDLTCDKIMADAKLRWRALALMREIQAAATAHGHVIEDAFLDLMMEHTDKMEPYYTSMHLDRREGRPMEIESIFGEPLRRGRAKAVPMPELERLYQALQKFL